jgi:hypothetical protein
MGLAPCRGCGYWLRADDVACADCGLRWAQPGQPWQLRLRLWCVGVALAIGVVAGGVAAGALWGAAAGGMAAALAGDRVHLRVAAQRSRARLAPPECLTGTSAELSTQLVTTELRLGRLASARATISEVIRDADQRVALEVTDNRAAVRLREQDVLVIRRWQIEYARWANRMTPVLDGIAAITFDEADDRLAVATELRRLGSGHFTRWRQQRAARHPDGHAFLLEVRAALAGVDTIRKELALRKALLADPDASFLAAPPAISSALARELDRFAQVDHAVTAGQYLLASGELADEHHRLAAEVAVEAEVA